MLHAGDIFPAARLAPLVKRHGIEVSGVAEIFLTSDSLDYNSKMFINSTNQRPLRS
jgi:hypothetical protein